MAKNGVSLMVLKPFGPLPRIKKKREIGKPYLSLPERPVDPALGRSPGLGVNRCSGPFLASGNLLSTNTIASADHDVSYSPRLPAGFAVQKFQVQMFKVGGLNCGTIELLNRFYQQWLVSAAFVAFTVAGTAPDLHRTSLTP